MERLSLVRSKLQPWIGKKITEYLGEEEPTLIHFVVDQLGKRATPDSILDELALVRIEDSVQRIDGEIGRSVFESG